MNRKEKLQGMENNFPKKNLHLLQSYFHCSKIICLNLHQSVIIDIHTYIHEKEPQSRGEENFVFYS